MSTNREQLFAKAAEERQKEKQKEEQKRLGGFSFDYEDIAYAPLSSDKDRIFRLLGNPPTVRENSFDPKVINISYIYGDNKKRHRVIWPSKEENPNWILWSVFDFVTKNRWDSTKNERIYQYKTTHPEIFNRVSKNGRVDQKFETGWKPKEVLIANVIDRHDPTWHKENQHTKLLAKKASKMENDVWYYEPGIPYYAYKIIWDDVVEYNGDWEYYDIALRKINESPFYKAFHGISDLKKITSNEKQYVVDSPLTEEEKSYKKYDIDNLFKVSSYQKINRMLGVFFQQIDKEFNTDFYKQLQILVEEEKKSFEDNKDDVSEDSDSSIENENENENEKENESVVEIDKDTHIEEKPAVRSVRKAPIESNKIPWDKLKDGSYNGIEYKGIDEMTEEEKSMVISINDDGSFNYIKNYNGSLVRLLESEDSNFVSPEQFHVDPLSGQLF